MRRRAGRWATPFGTWVAQLGVTTLVRQLHANGQPITNKAVYSWISGVGRPRMDTAMKLLGLSGGALTMEHILSQRDQAQGGGAHDTGQTPKNQTR